MGIKQNRFFAEYRQIQILIPDLSIFFSCILACVFGVLPYNKVWFFNSEVLPRPIKSRPLTGRMLIVHAVGDLLSALRRGREKRIRKA